MDCDCTISFRKAPQVALFLAIANDPWVLSDSYWVNEVGIRESSSFAVGGVRSVLGHTGIPIPHFLVELLYDCGVFRGEIPGLPGIPWKVEKLGVRPIKIDEVFPRSLTNSQVGIVFFKPMAESWAIRRTSPEEGSFARGLGLSDECLREVFPIQCGRWRGRSQGIERAVEIDCGEDRGGIGCTYRFFRH